jgi:hypothetical protein
MRSLLILSFFLAISILPCKAQNYDPLTLTKKIFSRTDFPEVKNYVTGEYNGRPNGKDIKNGLDISFLLLGQTPTTAVVNVTLTDSTGKQLDLYLHFIKQNTWKACAFRALAMTGIIAKVHDDLAKMTPAQIESVIAAPHTDSVDRRDFKSKEEYEFMLGNAGLTLASDRELTEHFNKNKAKFVALKNELLAKGLLTKHDTTNLIESNPEIKKHIRELLLDNVLPNFEETENSLDFLIGGIIDNAVGYFYFQNPKDVPEMSPNHFIMIKALGDGWYLYKTT